MVNKIVKKFKNATQKHNKSLKVLLFIILMIIGIYLASRIDVYILKCDLGDIFVKNEYEKMYTRFNNGLYDNLHDFSVNDKIITSTSNDPWIYLDTSDVKGFKYLNIDIELINSKETDLVIFFATDNKNFHENVPQIFKLKNGMNLIKIPEGYYSAIRLDLTEIEGISFIVNAVELTNKKVPAKENVITLFLLFILWCMGWLCILINKSIINKIINSFIPLKEKIIIFFSFIKIPNINNNVIFKIKPGFLLCLIIIIQIITILYYTDKKKGFHLDEIYSHTQANGNLIKKQARSDVNMFDNWNDKEYYSNFLTVQKEERFNFKSVYNTMKKNVNLPFYNMQLHAIYSFFPDIFSKWIAVIINIFWLTLTTIILYLLSRHIFENNFIALLPSAVWSLCNGAITSAIYFRVYATQTFFLTLVILMSIILINDNSNKIKYYLLFLLSLFFSLFSHNYSIILIVFVITLLFVYLYLIKEYKKVCNIVFVFALSIILLYASWPYVINQIFLSGRGAQAFETIQNVDNYLDKIITTLKVLNRDILSNIIPINLININNLLIFTLFLVLISIIIIRYYNIKNILISMADKKIFSYLFILTISFLYTLIITMVAPYLSGRYIMPIYPCVVLSFLGIFYYLFKKTRIKKIIIVILSIILIISNFSNRKVRELYTDTPNVAKILENFDSSSCIALFSNQIERTFYDFTQFDRTFISRNIETIDIALNNIEQGKNLFVYLSNDIDKNKIFDIIKNRFDFNDIQILYSNSGRVVYRIVW